MKKIKFSVNIEWPAPDDFDERTIVAFRPPRRREKYLSYGGEVCVLLSDMDDGFRPIIDDWQWPEWLTAAAVVLTPHGCWIATERVPRCDGLAWSGCGSVVDFRLTTFSPPPCDDWQKSLRVNPKFQADRQE